MECDEYSFVEDFRNVDVNDTEFVKKCLRIREYIESRKHTLVKFIEDLGVFLVDPSPNKRQYGVQILSTVLEHLQEDFLSPVELDYIAAFYTDRLKDHSQVIPATLRGILAIVKCKNVSVESINNLFSYMEINVSCQQQQVCDRKTIYSIFEEFFDRHHEEMLPALNHKLITIIMESMDGERDPRNLLSLFGWLPRVLKVVDLSGLEEPMFEILACYFPVDFKAPPQDPNAITRQQLADALCVCLCANPSFAEYCQPLALEKLDSSMQIAKIDSLKLIEQGSLTFTYSLFQARQLWTAIKEEIFNAKDDEVRTACWGALRTLLHNMLCKKDAESEEFLSFVIVSTRKYLVPSVPNFSTACRMVLQVADVSEHTCSYTANEIVPILTNTYNILVKVPEKVQMLSALVEFLLVSKKHRQNFDVNTDTNLAIIPTICLKETINEDASIQASAYSALAKITHLLPFTLRDALFVNFSAVIVKEVPRDVRCELLKCLEQCSVFYPKEIVEKVLPNISVTCLLSLRLYLEALCVLVSQPELSEHVSDIFVTHLTHDDGKTAALAVECLSDLFREGNVSDNVQEIFMKKDIVNRMVTWTMRNAVDLSDNASDRRVLRSVSFIISYLIGCQVSEVQSKVYQREMEHIAECRINKDIYMVLLCGLNLKLRIEVVPNYSILDEIIGELDTGISGDYMDYAARLIANLLNKCTNDEILTAYLGKLDALVNTSLDKTKDVFYMSQLISWITKALAQRNHPDLCIWLDKMINVVTRHEESVKVFKIVLDDSFEELNERSYCTKRLLYRQRFFSLACQKLSALYDLNAQTLPLVAFGYLWCHAPHQVILSQLNKMLKLTFMCLERSQDAEVLCIMLDTLKMFILKQETVINEHLEDFLQRILNLTTFQKSLKVRIAALQCLQHFTSGYPVYKLLPRKQEVLDVLATCIDDKKRTVRKEAVLCRSLWFLIDMET